MTSLEAYDSLYSRTKHLPYGSVVMIHPVDRCNLGKQTETDLKARSYGDREAEAVSNDLILGVKILGECMGLQLVVNRNARKMA